MPHASLWTPPPPPHPHTPTPPPPPPPHPHTLQRHAQPAGSHAHPSSGGAPRTCMRRRGNKAPLGGRKGGGCSASSAGGAGEVRLAHPPTLLQGPAGGGEAGSSPWLQRKEHTQAGPCAPPQTHVVDGDLPKPGPVSRRRGQHQAQGAHRAVRLYGDCFAAVRQRVGVGVHVVVPAPTRSRQRRAGCVAWACRARGRAWCWPGRARRQHFGSGSSSRSHSHSGSGSSSSSSSGSDSDSCFKQFSKTHSTSPDATKSSSTVSSGGWLPVSHINLANADCGMVQHKLANVAVVVCTPGKRR